MLFILDEDSVIDIDSIEFIFPNNNKMTDIDKFPYIVGLKSGNKVVIDKDAYNKLIKFLNQDAIRDRG